MAGDGISEIVHSIGRLTSTTGHLLDSQRVQDSFVVFYVAVLDFLLSARSLLEKSRRGKLRIGDVPSSVASDVADWNSARIAQAVLKPANKDEKLQKKLTRVRQAVEALDKEVTSEGKLMGLLLQDSWC